MGDKGGKKDKEKGQKQHAAKDKQENKRKLECWKLPANRGSAPVTFPVSNF